MNNIKDIFKVFPSKPEDDSQQIPNRVLFYENCLMELHTTYTISTKVLFVSLFIVITGICRTPAFSI